MSKMSKGAVDYGDGMPGSHCGICQHFIPKPSQTEPNECERVEGPIRASAWCKLFKRREE